MHRIQKHAIVIVLITLVAVFAVRQELTVRAAPAGKAAIQQSDTENPLGSIEGDYGRLRDDYLGENSIFVPLVTHCEILYFDNFSNPNSGWPEAQAGANLYEYRNGEYRILMGNAFTLAGAIPGVSVSDYLLTTDVRNFANKPGTYGLLFGQVNGFTGFYTFEIGNAKNYEIWRWNGSWVLLDTGTSPALKTGTASNTIAIERNGTLINAFANGEFVTSLSSGTFTGMLNVGVWATSYDEAGLDVRFDDYRIEPIGCGLSTASPQGPSSSGETSGSAGLPGWLEIELPARDH